MPAVVAVAAFTVEGPIPDAHRQKSKGQPLLHPTLKVCVLESSLKTRPHATVSGGEALRVGAVETAFSIRIMCP